MIKALWQQYDAHFANAQCALFFSCTVRFKIQSRELPSEKLSSEWLKLHLKIRLWSSSWSPIEYWLEYCFPKHGTVPYKFQTYLGSKSTDDVCADAKGHTTTSRFNKYVDCLRDREEKWATSKAFSFSEDLIMIFKKSRYFCSSWSSHSNSNLQFRCQARTLIDKKLLFRDISGTAWCLNESWGHKEILS